MYSKVKKQRLIDELSKVEDEAVLKKIEQTLALAKDAPKKRRSFTEFAGRISAEDLDQMEEEIKLQCGQIFEDDWK